MAIQLKLTSFREDEVQVVLSDHSRNTDVVAEKLNHENLFADVTFAETKSLDYSRGFFKILLFSLQCVFGHNKKLKFVERLQNIDGFMYFNESLSSQIAYAYLIRKNPNMVCSRFEEGIASYYNEIPIKPVGKRTKIIYHGLHAIGLKTLSESSNTFYCFYPKMYTGRMTPVAVKPLSTDDEFLAALLKRIFSISEEKLHYTQKYIYFASSIDSDNGISIEFDLVQKLAGILGKENILIKKHPRDWRTVYEDSGYIVDGNSAIPWEALQCCINLSDKVLISTFSSSVLSGSMMLEGGVETWILYNLCKDNSSIIKSARLPLEKAIDNMKRNNKLSKIKTIKSFGDIE